MKTLRPKAMASAVVVAAILLSGCANGDQTEGPSSPPTESQTAPETTASTKDTGVNVPPVEDVPLEGPTTFSGETHEISAGNDGSPVVDSQSGAFSGASLLVAGDDVADESRGAFALYDATDGTFLEPLDIFEGMKSGGLLGFSDGFIVQLTEKKQEGLSQVENHWLIRLDQKGSPEWEIHLEGKTQASLTRADVQGGTIAVPTAEGLIGIDLQTGAERWGPIAGQVVPNKLTENAAALLVRVQDGDSYNLRGVDPVTGDTIWESPTEGHMNVVVGGSRFYDGEGSVTADEDPWVAAYDLATGDRLGAPINIDYTSLIQASDIGVLAMNGHGRGVYFLDPASGVELWSLDLSFNELYGLVTNDMVYLAVNGQVVALDASTGDQVSYMDAENVVALLQAKSGTIMARTHDGVGFALYS